ncbi:MAG: hypothetical protein JJT96_14880 [Opitutales bacterium]|nr:hypothetical protein [Opitutales bacterium]
MLKINMHEAKTHLSRYARRVKAGETILLCDRNVPFAELRPLQPPSTGKRTLGMDAGRIALNPDWDTPVTNAEVTGLFGLDKKDGDPA